VITPERNIKLQLNLVITTPVYATPRL